MFFSRPAGVKLVFRGFITDPDFTEVDLIIDGGYHYLYLGDIIPVGSIAVILHLYIKAIAIGNSISVRHPDDTSAVIPLRAICNVVGQYASASGLIFCDSERSIRVSVSSNVSQLQLSVMGWIEK